MRTPTGGSGRWTDSKASMSRQRQADLYTLGGGGQCRILGALTTRPQTAGALLREAGLRDDRLGFLLIEDVSCQEQGRPGLSLRCDSREGRRGDRLDTSPRASGVTCAGLLIWSPSPPPPERPYRGQIAVLLNDLRLPVKVGRFTKEMISQISMASIAPCPGILASGSAGMLIQQEIADPLGSTRQRAIGGVGVFPTRLSTAVNLGPVRAPRARTVVKRQGLSIRSNDDFQGFFQKTKEVQDEVYSCSGDIRKFS